MLSHDEMLADLQQQYQRASNAEAEIKGKIALVEDQFVEIDGKLCDAQTNAEDYAEALDVLQAYASLQEKGVQERVCSIVTDGLRAVFDREDISFLVNFEISRGQMTVEPRFRMKIGQHEVETAARDAKGGGVLDVASFLLRCVMLVLLRPKLKRVLVCDEVFKHLSREHLPRAASLVKEMSERLGIQMLMVTHKDEFIDAADKVFDVGMKDGVTEIEER